MGYTPDVNPGAGRQEKSEQRKLRKLNRAARREARARSRSRRTARAPGEVEPPRRRPIVRKVLKWVGIAAAASLVLAIIYPPFLVPVQGPVTSRFFLRTDPESIFLFDVEHHRGIDIGAAHGTPVRAARSGRVIRVLRHETYGLIVEVRHPLGLTSRYAHLSASNVETGDWIWRRRRVGSVGMTGRATGPHLHFEIRLGNWSLPPGLFLLPHQIRRLVVS
jgi:murein DD-endopeptidase MepM/ murein hydrolase activator NlpD